MRRAQNIRLAQAQPMQISSAEVGVPGAVGDERRERRSRSM
jgi:hypothetical protein